MPTYEYACQECGHEFEEFQSITAKSLRKCPECGKLKLKRLIGTGAGVIFKGSGFYETDYRSDSYKKAEKADKESTSSSSSDSKSDSKSSDSKTTAKSESTSTTTTTSKKSETKKKSKD